MYAWHHKQKQQGFTLIELMVVVTIIAILVSIALPNYQKYTRKARFAEVVQAAAVLKVAVEQCFQLQGQLNDCQSGKHGIGKTQHPKGNGLISSSTVTAGGVIVITAKARYGFQGNETYTLTPQAEDDWLHWRSGGSAVIAGYAQ